MLPMPASGRFSIADAVSAFYASPHRRERDAFNHDGPVCTSSSPSLGLGVHRIKMCHTVSQCRQFFFKIYGRACLQENADEAALRWLELSRRCAPGGRR